jgi:S-adenosylmethionine:tRNA ribosyltransferase-isomerase
MKRSELSYHLPPVLIAQAPAEPRDASRLMVVERATGAIRHHIFREIGDHLRAGDCLVLNDTRVIPARFFCRRRSGGRVEALFLREDEKLWRVLLRPSNRLNPRETIVSETAEAEFELVERLERGEWRIRPPDGANPVALLSQIGQTPLPPYIDRSRGVSAEDVVRYQTVYAEHPGAVAAPTAGLHFTPELLTDLASHGVQRAIVTLHVGLGTFSPIEAENLAAHKMHSEWARVSAETADRLGRVRANGGRIVAVGTTSARTLETMKPGLGEPLEGWTDLFVYPPYTFRHVDALLTNFHLPESTLLALVMAFAGVELVRRAYQEAIERAYRFYSYGDAMLIV